MWGKASIKSDCSISEMSVLSISNVVSGNTSTSLIRDREITNTPDEQTAQDDGKAGCQSVMFVFLCYQRHTSFPNLAGK